MSTNEFLCFHVQVPLWCNAKAYWAVWDAVFQTCAVTVWTRRTRQAVTLATRSRGGSVCVQRTRSRPCPASKVAGGNTITVMTSRTRIEDRISYKHIIQQGRRKVFNLLLHWKHCSWGIHFKYGNICLRNMLLYSHEPHRRKKWALYNTKAYII